MAELAEKVAELGGDIHGSLQEVPLPMYILDRKGVIVWVNDAAAAIVPGVVGKKFTEALAPDRVHTARRIFALRIMGQRPFADHTTTIRLTDGGRLAPDGTYRVAVAAGASRREAGSVELHRYFFPVRGPHGTRGPSLR